MRLFEVLILALDLLYLAWVVRRRRWLNWLPITAVLLIPLHLALEGYRWQMVLAYGLTAALAGTAVWRLRTDAAPGWVWRGLGFLAGWLVLSAAVALPWLMPVPQLPQPTGPLAIGTTTFYLVDENRGEIWTDDPDDYREIIAQIWYPTAPEPAGKTAPYLENLDVAGPALADQFDLPPFLFDHINLVQTAAYPDAPVADGRWPIILFSHGLTGLRGQNTGMAQELASRGFVVAAIDHTYGNVLTVFPDGRILFYDPCRIEPSCTMTAFVGGRQLVGQWAEDIAFALDEMAGWQNDPNNRFFNRLNLDSVGAFGHSTGGGAAVQFCNDDARCDASLALDGWMLPVTDDVEILRRPVMFISAPVWLGAENEARGKAMYAQAAGPAFNLTIADTAHYDFSDMPLFSPLTPQLGLSGTIDGKRVSTILNQYVVAFFSQYLARADGELLSQTAVFPEVTMQSRP